MKKLLQGLAVSVFMFLGASPAESGTTSAAADVATDDAFARLVSDRPATAPGESATRLASGQWLLAGGNLQPAQLRLLQGDLRRVEVLQPRLFQPRSGHSATLMPDGTVLIFGGTAPDGSVRDTAERFDPYTSTLSVVGVVGLLPRTGHTATVLADGRILFAGGSGADHQPLLDAELFNPKSMQVERFDVRLDSARLNQIAALLPDRAGSLLLLGGTNGRGHPRMDGDLYSPETKKFSTVDSENAEKLSRLLANAEIPRVLDSVPAAHTTNAVISGPLSVRFSKRMDVATLNAQTIVLIGPNGNTSLRPVAVEGGVVLFVTPVQDLLPGSDYTLFVQGATDEQARPLPFTAISFKTAALTNGGSPEGGPRTAPASPASANGEFTTGQGDSSKAPLLSAGGSPLSVDKGSNYFYSHTIAASLIASDVPAALESNDAEIPFDNSAAWSVDAGRYHGNWTSGRRLSAHKTPPAQEAIRRAFYPDPRISQLTPASVAHGAIKKLKAAGVFDKLSGPTSVAGQVLKLDGKPLSGATLSVGAHAVQTDDNGEFLLSDIASGHQILVIDGATGGNGGETYGRYEYGVDVEPGKINALPFVIWMTRLDHAGDADITSPTNTPVVLTNPQIPGLELHIPAGTVIRDADGRIVTHLNLTAIPTDQPPFPIPAVQVPTYFTVQPGGAHLEAADGRVSQGAQLIYPNFTHSAPGARITFWNYDAPAKGWYEYGQGTVTADGLQVVPDPGVVIYEFSGAMVSLPSNAPLKGPPPGECTSGKVADPVSCYTGLFLNEGELLPLKDSAGVPAAARVYRQSDSASRAFGIGTNLSYDMFTVGDTNPWTYQDLILPDGGRVHYTKISPGDSFAASIYQNTTTPGEFYGSIIKYTYSYWTLELKDGRKYAFADREASPSARQAALRGMEDAQGNPVILDRDAQANLTRITSPNGRHLNLTYDGSNRVTQVSDDVGTTVSYAYDAGGRLSTVTDVAGHQEQYTYDSNNNMLTVTDKRGNTKVANVYDSNNRVIQQNYPDGTSVSFAYTVDTNDHVTQMDYTDERGMVARRTFNANGYITSITEAVGLPEQQITTFDRDPDTNLINSVTDALSRTTSYTYDALGNITHVTFPDATSMSMAYDPVTNRVTQVTDRNGLVRQATYDSVGNLLTAVDSLNHTSTFTHDGQGRLKTATDALGHQTAINYFGADVSSVTDALGHQSSIDTDFIGRVNRAVDPLQNASSITYDNLGRVQGATDPNGSGVGFTYDNNGNVLTQKDANNNVTTFTYDAMNRVSSKLDALGHIEIYEYEAGGAISRKTDRKGQVTQWTYDILGRPTQVGYGATVSDPTTFTSTTAAVWDAGDRLIQIVDSDSGSITRAYDAMDRLTQETTPQGTVNYTYDAGGRRQTMSASGLPTVTYTWDNANRLTQIQQAADAINGNQTQTVLLSYDDANRRTSLTLPNGVHAAYGYNDINQLTSIFYTKADDSALGDLQYSYDAAGRRIAIDGSLASVAAPALSTSSAYNANNQLTSFADSSSSVSPSYDANGNMISDGINSYTWDARNYLVAINSGSSNALSFSYDAVGRRIGQTQGSASTSYQYDGHNKLQEAGAVTASYLSGGLDENFVRQQGGVNQYFARDALGSTIGLLDSSAAWTQNYSYEAYGETTSSGSSDNDVQYTGREAIGPKAYYYRNRYYNATLKRFISEDPIGWGSGQANNYAYVGGNPTSYVDSSGLNLQGSLIGAGIGSAIGGIAGVIVGATGGTFVAPGVGTVGGGIGGGAEGASSGAVIGAYIGDKISDALSGPYQSSEFKPGFWAGDKGAAEWGRRNGLGAREGKGRFHGIKQSCPGSRATDNFGVNPATGDVVDPEGEVVGNLDEVKSK
jgi:RHS repeat-associated protein